MVQFLFVLGFAALVIVFGVSVSYSLYRHGAIGRRSVRRLAPVKAFVTEPAFDEDEDDYRISTSMVDETSLYARRALLVMLGALVFVGAFIAMLFH